ncbi:ATP-binding protein [Emcibacter sp.]|uniref:sensor histidine kinase NtrY-like n=1 Tax=Emcibacter sp. TaxID=1979954 RepID=UPI003A8FCD25
MSQVIDKKTPRSFFRFILWAKRIKLTNKVAYLLAVGVLLSGILTYATFSELGPIEPIPTPIGLLLFNLILLLVLGTLVSRQLVKLLSARKAGMAGARLHSRIITLFSIVAITPTIIVAVFSALFFEFGLQAWFNDKVQTVLNSSQSVAEAYIEEHKKVIKADILGMSRDLNAQGLAMSNNRDLLEQALTGMSQILGLSEAIILSSTEVVARAKGSLSLISEPFPLQALNLAAEGKVVFLSSEDDDRIRVLIQLDGFLDRYLYISRFVDSRALALVNEASEAQKQYNDVLANLSEYRLLFNLTFIVIALLILFAAVWMGLRLVNKLMEPIGNLINASAQVGKGDFSARAPIENTYDDLGGLTKAFNNMTWQLENQQKDLLNANLQLDERRRFTETVLSGVSAGIMGLAPDGIITLPNRSAAHLLGEKTDKLKGKLLTDVLPEAGELFDKVKSGNSKSLQQQITLKRGENTLNLLVRITAEMKDGEVEGFVISFDDITDQVAAQRTAAWADVARRVAHEIKNPLTPIQLSAERLKRKYGKEIKTDVAVFEQCTDTIIRQVGDLRQMVDEFSSFARMPAPVIKPENLAEIIKQSVFLMEVANSDIGFSIKMYDKTLPVMCDARLIGQALTNLIKNATEAIAALQETTPDIKGKIRIDVEQKGEDKILVYVSDNGVGLPEELLHRLTEPYVTTRAKGTGLGLAIVKKIMKDHGGDLVLENQEQGGARACLIFSTDESVRESLEYEDDLRIVHGS